MNTWIATLADEREISIKAWCEPAGARPNWFARAGDSAPSIAVSEMTAVAWAVPRREAVIELRRENEPSRAQMRAALEAIYEHASTRCDRCSGYIEPLTDCADCDGTGTVPKAVDAFALVRTVLGGK